ncbi:unnamed protein product [Cylindrotheca closterium]|uniref:TLC domain-containing protein n=1 Tax=Cylindrotheca closterium TaxID=2856 RepID=A0AAD2FH60_9STRA|nr:unnamed protein product [Cylindrotheca closterium]
MMKKTGGMLKLLLSCYRSLPKVIQIGKLDFTFTFVSFAALSVIRTIFFQLLTAYYGWPIRSKMTTDAAASLASIVHSIVLCWLLTEWFWKLGFRAYFPSGKLSDHNSDMKDSAVACLQVCTGYMLFDALWLIGNSYQLNILPLTEFETLVLAHHVLTSFYMISCRVIGAGHISAMILMLTGEISNPLMNGMFVTRFAIQLECCKHSEFIVMLHSLLEPSFAVVYIIFRTTIGPACAIHLAWDVLCTKQGRQNIPLLLSVFWVIMVIGVLVGSGPFIGEAIEMLQDGWKLKYTPDYDYGDRYRIHGGDEL